MRRIAVVTVVMMCALVLHPLAAWAAPVLTITPITWDVLGLDSNKPGPPDNDGPNLFTVGARVCNTGTTTSTQVDATFVWDTANSYINIQSGSPSTITMYYLDPAECFDYYFNIEVTRDTAAWDTVRGYHITATGDGGVTATTPTPRQLYIEHLISQNRNAITSISGPTTVYVGSTYTYSVTGKTATGGYEQLTTYLNFPNVIFQVIDVSAVYAVPPAGTNDKIYADACGWDPVPTSPNYKSCIGPEQYPGGKAGGNPVTTTFNVKIMSAGVATMTALWYDFSGSSYHYNSDYGVAPNSITVTALKPTAVRSVHGTATATEDGTLVTWTTASEVDNLGFNVYREHDGLRERVNTDLIAGSALMTDASLSAGGTYSWFDAPAHGPPGTYWIEAIDLNGSSSWHGPFQATQGETSGTARRSPTLSESPSGGAGATVPRVASVQAAAPADGSSSAGAAAKIGVRHEGWYRVPLADLEVAGVDVSRPGQLHLVAEGVEQAVTIREDALEFYGLGLDSPNTDTRVYWVTSGDGPGRRIATVASGDAPVGPASFRSAVERSDEDLYFSALLNGDEDNFFGAAVTSSPVEQALTVPHLRDPAGASLSVVLQGVTAGPHDVEVALNGSPLGSVGFAGRDEGVASFPVDGSVIDGDDVVTLTATEQGDVSVVASVRIDYDRALVADGDRLRFSAPGGTRVSVGGFADAGVRVVDVTDPAVPVEIEATVAPGEGGNVATLSVPGTGERTLFAFSQPDDAAWIARDRPSNLSSSANGADLVVVTTGDLRPALRQLVALRERQGLRVRVVDIQDVDDEFGFGEESPAALRAFLTFAHRSWSTAPRYVLLAGDASLDPRNYLGHGDSDLVPTMLVDTKLMETASDSALADADGDGRPDVALGRLPVGSVGQAQQVVDKLVAYDRTRGDRSALFVADKRFEGGRFTATNSAVQRLLPPGTGVTSVERQGSSDADYRQVVQDGIDAGPSLVEYAGHGSVDLWAGRPLTSGDASSLGNTERPAFFVLMTCLNGYYQDPALDGLGEALLRADGGAVGVYASTGMTYVNQQRALTVSFHRALFDGAPRVGDAALAASRSSRAEDVVATWVLLGDPTMRLR